jgi:hypothetical protein
MAGEGRPGCKDPMVCMALLMAQSPYINPYFPLAFFSIIKIENRNSYSMDYSKAPDIQFLFVVPKYEPVVIFVLKMAMINPYRLID